MPHLCGVGVNDAWYVVDKLIDGKRVMCPYYSKWSSMIMRCYNKKSLMRRPTYVDVVVCEDWLIFSNFRKWMVSQDWVGCDLDKDVLYPNNKTYSPKTCCFIEPNLNLLLTNNKNKNTPLPTGVHLHKPNGKYIVQIGVGASRVRLGQYNTVDEARTIYVKAKIENIKSYYGEVDKRVKKGLKRHVKLLKKEIQ